MVDAYNSVVYNEITKQIGTEKGRVYQLLNSKYNIPCTAFSRDYYGDTVDTKGVFRTLFGRLYMNYFTLSHIDQARYPDHMLGIKSPEYGGAGSNSWFYASRNDWTILASRGGITIALSKEPDDTSTQTIKVYYHIYDPDDSNPKEHPTLVIAFSYSHQSTNVNPLKDCQY